MFQDESERFCWKTNRFSEIILISFEVPFDIALMRRQQIPAAKSYFIGPNSFTFLPREASDMSVQGTSTLVPLSYDYKPVPLRSVGLVRHWRGTLLSPALWAPFLWDVDGFVLYLVLTIDAFARPHTHEESVACAISIFVNRIYLPFRIPLGLTLQTRGLYLYTCHSSVPAIARSTRSTSFTSEYEERGRYLKREIWFCIAGSIIHILLHFLYISKAMRFILFSFVSCIEQPTCRTMRR